MAMNGEAGGAKPLAPVRARLAAARRTLAAAGLAILALDLWAGGSGLRAALAFAAVLAVAALVAPAPDVPRRRPREERREGGFERLPARHLAAAVPDPLIVFDRDGTLLFANAPAVAAFGALPVGTALPLRFRTPEMHALLDGVLQAGRAQALADYMERVPIERLYRVSARPIGEASGLFVLMFEDQSEARRIDRMRADFIANASHELRTPLASIAGFIETLRGPARDDAAARDSFLQIMQAQTARMARLIDDLLSLSRLEVKPYIDPDSRVDLARLARQVSESLARLAADSGLVIETRLPDAPLMVAGHADELTQVLENLVENACKYAGDGGRIVVSATRDAATEPPEVTVTVTDFGPGIPKEHIPRLTERFYRVDVEASRAQKGTGLGLAIVKHILTRHGGRLSIRSELGAGAAFTIHLPAA
ncbi:ATP-binding protein [Aquibium sp. A9E412]|uniref:ATP-binding protein n=1 Tax=Aquibium sp. A9E412 TaxID=2976767 RepID=UPI0025B1A3DF|nr:ATP-binding protein [Aquibium sp. A9E412]MDN2566699.1 ATP-binding protein [Aquibium sp. A9E412]